MALVTTVAEVLSLAWKLLHEVGVDKKKKKKRVGAWQGDLHGKKGTNLREITIKGWGYGGNFH